MRPPPTLTQPTLHQALRQCKAAKGTAIMSALENSTVLAASDGAGELSLAHSWHRLTSSVVYMAGAMAKRLEQRRAIAELTRLDDRLLEDIGISRGEIFYVVHNGRTTVTN